MPSVAKIVTALSNRRFLGRCVPWRASDLASGFGFPVGLQSGPEHAHPQCHSHHAACLEFCKMRQSSVGGTGLRLLVYNFCGTNTK
jgi:hypothetical protein